MEIQEHKVEKQLTGLFQIINKSNKTKPKCTGKASRASMMG